MEDWYTPNHPAPLPDAARVLVLAPHPDDEVLGCGGLLAQLAQRGAHIEVLLLTDGGGYQEGSAREAYVAQRLAESQAAAALLGASVRSLQWPDRQLDRQPQALLTLAQALAQARADLLLAPAPSEIHPDHMACARLCLGALAWLQQHQQPLPQLWQYEVGQPLLPNVLIDITPVIERKREAIALFASQLAQQDYSRHILALNAYRTYSLPPQLGVRWAEGFRRFSAQALQAQLAQPDAPASHALLSRMREALELAQLQCEQQAAQLRQQHSAEVARQALDAATQSLREELAVWQALNAARQAEQALAAEQLAQLQHTCAAQAQDLAQLQHTCAAQTQELAQLQNTCAAQAQELALVRRSHSWRLTAPLRWLGQAWRARGR